MTGSDFADDLDVEDIESGGGGKIKRAVGLVAVLAVLVALTKLKNRGGSSAEAEPPERGEVEHPDVDADHTEEEGIDTVSTTDADETETAHTDDEGTLDVGGESETDEDDESGLNVKTSKNRGISATSGRFEDLDIVDYLAIFASALQAARDEYRIRTED